MNDIIVRLEKVLNESLVYFRKIQGNDHLVDELITECNRLIEKNKNYWGQDRGKIALVNTYIIANTLGILQKYSQYFKSNTEQSKILSDQINKSEEVLDEIRMQM